MHAVILCNEKEWNKFKDGLIVYDRKRNRFISREEALEKIKDNCDYQEELENIINFDSYEISRQMLYNGFFDFMSRHTEETHISRELENGEKIYAVSMYYGDF